MPCTTRRKSPAPVLAPALLALPCGFALAMAVSAQIGTVDSWQKISATQGGFGGDPAGGALGSSVAPLGDLNGDGVLDLAVGAMFDDGESVNEGAVWVLFLRADGTVAGEQKIGAWTGGFAGDLDVGDLFGASLAPLGDLDGDGLTELAVGAIGDDDGSMPDPNFNVGAVWILFLDPQGCVRTAQKISDEAGGFGGSLARNNDFGSALAPLGDLDGDGVADLAVGASGVRSEGIVWIVFLNADGTVKDELRIGEGRGGFGGTLSGFDEFGISVCALGDLDGDLVVDLAVGAAGDDDGGPQGSELGAVWILFLRPDGTVRSEQKITETLGGFGGSLDPSDQFGRSLEAVGDLDGDGVPDLAVGAIGDDGFRGVVWILLLNPDGTVKTEHRIGPGSGGFGGVSDPGEGFGWSIAAVGDIDGDDSGDLAVGALFDGDGGQGNGAVWILFLEGQPVCGTLTFEVEDDFVTPLVNGQHIDTEFGAFVTLTSSGTNQGMAIFDSTPGGPNDPSQDPDLLVDSGNILILQTENQPPDANDVFPRPNDDEDGGGIHFAFDPPVELRSLRLIDIDASDGLSALVLRDGSARRRTYLVPASWTGDRTLSQPGAGTLDLTTLLPQPGFDSSATASEDAGFDPECVVQLDVHLDGSGGLDDLCLRGPSLPRAGVSVRNGSGANPSWLRSAARPVLGTSWRAYLDCPALDGGLALLSVRSRPTSGVLSPYGERLISGELLHSGLRPLTAGTCRFTLDIPSSLPFQGLELHVQGLVRASSGAGPRKALPARAQLTNALHLRLGF